MKKLSAAAAISTIIGLLGANPAAANLKPTIASIAGGTAGIDVDKNLVVFKDTRQDNHCIYLLLNGTTATAQNCSNTWTELDATNINTYQVCETNTWTCSAPEPTR